MDAGVAFAGAAAQADLVRRGEVSARELTQLSLDRIAEHDPVLNAFRIVFAERALAEADQADARRQAGEERPLLGVPIAVKDDMDVAGEVTAKGSIAHGGPAAQDDELVRRLRDQGAVIVGKTNVPELMTMAFTETLWYGVTRNPWDLDRTPGGSSGGSAAAVAAGLVPAATASDGTGSIRIPAASSGLVGLKCGAGVIPTPPPAWNGLSTFGFLTRTAADAALVNGIEPAPRRPLTIHWSVKPPPGALTGPDAEVAAAIERMVAVLGDLGHTVEQRDPDLGLAGIRTVTRYLRGIADDAAAMAHPERLDRRSKGLARLGRLTVGFASARRAAAQDRARFEASIGDVLMLPVINTLPPRIGEYEAMNAVRSLNKALNYTPYPGLANHMGLPAIAVPTPGDGFPRAVQFVGRTGSEPLLLALAAALEEHIGFADRIPPGFG